MERFVLGIAVVSLRTSIGIYIYVDRENISFDLDASGYFWNLLQRKTER
jgi:hypothetical protein